MGLKGQGALQRAYAPEVFLEGEYEATEYK